MGAVGSIQAHFNVGAMRQIPIPELPISKQQELAEKATAELDRIDDLLGRLDLQLSLLASRRQALINAAVTGQFATIMIRQGAVV